MTPAGVSAFAATHWVGDWVHCGTTDPRPNAFPAIPTGLSDDHTGMLAVADEPDSCPAGTGDATNFSAGERKLGPAAVASVQCGTHSGTAAQLGAAPRLHLNVMYDGTKGDRTERHAVAHVRLNRGPAFDFCAGGQSFWCDNVAFLSVSVLNQSDAGGAIGIVLNVGHCTHNPVLIPLKVNDSIEPFVATATVLCGNLTLIVATALLFEADAEFLLGAFAAVGDFGEITDGGATPSRSHWFVEAETHESTFVGFAGLLMLVCWDLRRRQSDRRHAT